MNEELQALLIEVAELNDEEAIKATNHILMNVKGEYGSETWLQSLSQGLADELTSLRIDKPGLKIGEIMRKLQK